MLVDLCTKCKTKLAISPEGLCNICDEEALHKRVDEINHEMTTEKVTVNNRTFAIHTIDLDKPKH